MKVIYDDASDILTIRLREIVATESDELRPGVIVDLDARGDLVAIEILDASRRVDDPSGLRNRDIDAA